MLYHSSTYVSMFSRVGFSEMEGSLHFCFSSSVKLFQCVRLKLGLGSEKF